MQATRNPAPLPRLGRYELLVRIGKGGMASVYLARVRGDAGFARLHAIKILHPHLAGDAQLVEMLLDEARLASRIHHRNVVSTVDVGTHEGRLYLVMDYVDGPALDRLLRRSPVYRPPERIVPLAIDALRGLHAAHELCDEDGKPLELVHRDVTPGNLLVGVDGTARITDFGVAKARARLTKTREGVVKGKAGYIAPEVLLGKPIDRRADVFSMGVLLWNALTGETLFETEDLASTLRALLEKDVPPPSTVGLKPPPIFDAPILMALARDPKHRHESALEMAQALSDALLMVGGGADPDAIGGWVREVFGEQLETRRRAARTPTQEATWDPEHVEPPSTSGLVRREPTGRVVSVLPDPNERVAPAEPAPIEGEPEPIDDEPAPRRRAWLVVSLLVLLGLGIGAAAALWARRRATSAEPTGPGPPAPAAVAEPTADERAPVEPADLHRDVRRRDEGL